MDKETHRITNADNVLFGEIQVLLAESQKEDGRTKRLLSRRHASTKL